MTATLEPVTIRPAHAADEPALLRLAALDSAAMPPAPLLLAEVDGELRAALSLWDGTTIADPFHPTVALVDLLRARATTRRPARTRHVARRRHRLSLA